jgi:hypothetical protein
LQFVLGYDSASKWTLGAVDTVGDGITGAVEGIENGITKNIAKNNSKIQN